jgi:hypothetical protein
MKNFAQKKYQQRKDQAEDSIQAVRGLYEDMNHFDGMPVFDREGERLEVGQSSDPERDEVYLRLNRSDNKLDLMNIVPAVQHNQDEVVVEVIRFGHIMRRANKLGRKGDRYNAISQLFTGFNLGVTTDETSVLMSPDDASRMFSHLFAWVASREATPWFR